MLYIELFLTIYRSITQIILNHRSHHPRALGDGLLFLLSLILFRSLSHLALSVLQATIEGGLGLFLVSNNCCIELQTNRSSML